VYDGLGARRAPGYVDVHGYILVYPTTAYES